MLSLHEKGKGGQKAVQICTISGKKRGDTQKVFWLAEISQDLMSQVDNTGDLLKNHFEKAKDRLKVNQSSLDEAVGLLHKKKEPDASASADLKRSFFYLRRLQRDLLLNEMQLDRPLQFSINIPEKKQEWFGNLAVIGASNSGKGYWLKQLLLRHWKTASPKNRRRVCWVSPELYLDSTLAEIRDSRKYNDLGLFTGIDVSVEGGQDSGLSPAEFYKQRVYNVVSELRDSLVIFDDVRDAYCAQQIRELSDSMMRTARHRNNSAIPIFHSIKSGVWTQQIMNSVKHLVIFPMASKGKIGFFFRDTMGMSIRDARELVARLIRAGRATVVRLHAPALVFTDRYLKLL